MGFEYSSTIDIQDNHDVLHCLEKVMNQVSSVQYFGQEGMSFGFNSHERQPDEKWGEEIQISYIPQDNELYVVFLLAPDDDFLKEFTTLLKQEGVTVNFEEL